MYFYFFCEYPAVVKLQGVIFGAVDNSVKFCNLQEPYPLVEICPLMNESRPFAFYITEKFLNAPPPNVSVVDLKGGYFLRFMKTGTETEFKVIAQEKFRDAAITLFSENGYKISLETQTDFFAETLDFSPISATFTRGENGNGLIFGLFDSINKKILKVYSVNPPAPILAKETDEFQITPTGFKTTERLKDMAKHEIVREYAADGNTVKEISRTVKSDEKFDREKLPERLVPYAFSEEYLCGGDYAFYLADGIKENADKLGGFFGDYIGVTTPPIFRNYKEIGFIRKVAERRYAAEYFTFDLADGKITNIVKI